MVWKSTMGQPCSGSRGLVGQEGFPALYQVLPITLQHSAGFRGGRPSPRMCITLPTKCGLHPEAKLDRFRASRQMLPTPRFLKLKSLLKACGYLGFVYLGLFFLKRDCSLSLAGAKTKQVRTLSGELYNNTRLPEAASLSSKKPGRNTLILAVIGAAKDETK